MGLLDNLERGLEKAVRSAFSAGGARAVQPVEIASALRHAMDDESFALSEGHTVAPNDFTVHFAPADFDRARTWGSTLAGELCDEVIRHAQSQGYTLPGSVRVAFHEDAQVHAGQVEVDARIDDGSSPVPSPPAATSAPAPAAARTADDRGPRPSRAPRHGATAAPAPRRDPSPAPHPAPTPARSESARRAPADEQATVVMPRRTSPAPAVPWLEADGVRHPLTHEDMVLGRSSERADVVVPDSSVSRQHARLVRVGRSVTLIDLGSRNGVTVNGRRVDGSTVLREGDRITVGQTDLVFHIDPADGRPRA